MTTRKVPYCVALIAVFVLAGCGDSTASSTRAIIADLNGVRDIMSKNMETPAEGMKALRTHAQERLPDFMRNVTQIMMALDKMPGAGDRSKRMKEIVDELTPVMKNLKSEADKFGARASADPKATQLMKEWGKDYEDTFKELQPIMRNVGGPF